MQLQHRHECLCHADTGIIRRVFRAAVTALLAASACFCQQVITTVAGSDFVFPATPLAAASAPVAAAYALAFDSAGNLLFSDFTSRVFKVTPSGVLTVFAGNGIVGFSGDGGPATAASMDTPKGIAVDSSGHVYIAEGARVRKVSPAGIITTFAGNGTSGFSGDGAAATAAALNSPSGLAADTHGNVYIADTLNSRIRAVSSAGIISTFAGNDRSDFSGDNGPAVSASLNGPNGVAVDSMSNVYIADTGNNRIRKVTPAGMITTVAGNGMAALAGDNGPATSAALNTPTGLVVDSSGTQYIADYGNHKIRKVSPGGTITSFAGNGIGFFAGDGQAATAASLHFPTGVALDSVNNVYIGDTFNGRIRRVMPSGMIGTFAGNGQFGFSGDGGPASTASLSSPSGVAVDLMGSLYIADTANSRIRKVSPAGVISTVAGNGGLGFTGDGGMATAATLFDPFGIAVDKNGNFYIADTGNSRIRKVSPQGTIGPFAGNGQAGYSGDGASAASASLNQPLGVAVDPAGTNVFIADTFNSRIRKTSPDPTISTLAGNNQAGFSGDGIPAAMASLNFPQGVALDSMGNVYIGDTANSRVREVTAATGLITTIAGNGQRGTSADGGAAKDALLNAPAGIAVDLLGNVYFAESGNNKVRKVSPGGMISTVAGNGKAAYSGDGGPATAASLSNPFAVALDAVGNVYIADSRNNRIRKVLAVPPVLACNPQTLSFASSAGSAPAPSQALIISSSVPYVTFTVAVTTSDGAKWLLADVASGGTPRIVEITADPSQLNAGTYSGQVVISSAVASGSPITIPVSFAVGPGLPPMLAVDQSGPLTFTYPAGATARSQAVRVRNVGGGTLNFTVNVSPAAPWLTVAPSAGSVTPSAAVTLAVTADPTGLSPGSYAGSFTVVADTTVTVSVLMNVSDNPSALLLSQTGLSFTAVAQGGTVPPQNFGIVNLGAGPLSPSVSATTVTGGNWLQQSLRTDASGAQLVDVSVDAGKLAPGRYYGLVSVQSPGAANTPQAATAMLQVLPAGTPLGAAILPNELTFNAVFGPGSPSSQTVSVYNLTARPVGFLASPADAFVKIAPQSGVVAPDRPTQIVIQPFTNNLAPGTYQDSITLQFDDGNVRVVRLTIVVSTAPGASGQAKRVAQDAPSASCQPTQLLPAITSLGAGFGVPAGWPVAIQVQVQDDCGQPLQSGSVVAEFSNGDPPVSLLSLPGGRWDGTWQTKANSTAITVTVRAITSDQQLSGTKQVAGAFNANQQPPLISGVLNAAANLAFQPLTPGGLITISGTLLSDQIAQATSVPFGESLGDTSASIAGQPMPIATTDPGKVSAIIPYGIPVNTPQQLILQRADTLSLPIQINMAAASPAIFVGSGGQGMIADANGNLIGPGNPAKSGDTITIYCSGLGELTTTVAAGDYGPQYSATTTTVAVNIGGQPATVNYSGLAPALVGIYIVQAKIPDGVSSGDQVPVTVTSQTTPPAVSPAVTTSITN